jgi:methanogenic corrinoid protein MtbC1
MYDRNASSELIQAIAELDENATLAMVQSRLAAGDDPFQIMGDCQAGLRQVGLRYEQRRYYLSGLIMASEIFREVLELLQPRLRPRTAGQTVGRILIGTVQGDIHDIGKNMASMLLTSHGFTVIDLGVDVPATEFVARTLEATPDIVGLSCLLSSAYESMKTTVALLKAETTRPDWTLPIVIGGGMLDEHVFRYVGADHFVTDAMDGVRLCLRLTADRHRRASPEAAGTPS